MSLFAALGRPFLDANIAYSFIRSVFAAVKEPVGGTQSTDDTGYQSDALIIATL